MSCRDFETCFDEYLEGRLSDAVERRLSAHLASCAACRELAEVARGDAEPPEAGVAELREAIVGATSGMAWRASGATGAACGLPYGELCAWAEGTLHGARREKVRLHLALCEECRALSVALGRLSEDLPALAARQAAPRPAFLPLEARLALWAARAAARAGEVGLRLLARPRIALEGAYVGTLVLTLFFVLPGSPLGPASAHALELVRANPVRALAAPAETVRDRAAALWRTVAEPGAAALDKLEDGVALRYRGVHEAAAEMKRHGAELGDAALELDFAAGGAAFRNLSGAFGTFWQNLFAGPRQRTAPTDETTTEDNSTSGENP